MDGGRGRQDNRETVACRAPTPLVGRVGVEMEVSFSPEVRGKEDEVRPSEEKQISRLKGEGQYRGFVKQYQLLIR